ncbi:MAG: phosphate ABC transporter permease PstA [Gammaproteobacteria bacterium]|nr:phosphate ABC transporter permease PstA [Gammaproteobacteria bacterium]
MTNSSTLSTGLSAREMVQARMAKTLRRRHRRERNFRLAGLTSVCVALACVLLLFGSILNRGLPAFWQSTIELPLYFDPQIIKVDPAPQPLADESPAQFRERELAWRGQLARINWQRLLADSVQRLYPEEKIDLRHSRALFTRASQHEVRELFAANPQLLGQTTDVRLLADANVDVWLRGNIDRSLPDNQQQLSAQTRELADRLKADDHIGLKFSSSLFTNSDSRSSPASAGLLGAFMGSFYMLLIVLLVAVPVGVCAAIYLEEFAPKNRWVDLIEVNINNLAAVPSIVFGLLGAALFINWFRLPMSAPLVGGLVLSLMSLPTVIIATRAALQAVPGSIRQAALAMGASNTQTVFHHVLPLALPGVLTGAILAVAQSLGETAPLLLIGMNAFVANVPASPMDQSTALSVQIFLWQGHELRNFFEARTSAAIIVLLTLMISLNAIAIYLRKRLENKWS